ncbi:MAG: hypothetical protein KA166_00875 [Saprospiraceae bacterium]|nr:hypothetical protein [Saprospiraceae bacterium]
MRIGILCCFFLFQISMLYGQQGTPWAGPDTISCGEKGVVIGSMVSCPGCCFSWSPTEGLSDSKIQNPVAKPRKKTVYSVIVTDENLSWKETDAVEVDLSFGEIHFVKDHLVQGTDEFVLGKLLNNSGNDETTWSILGDDLDCTLEPNQIDENRVTIYPGDKYGKLIIKVKKDADAECFFRDTLPVNSGVKDLILVDPLHPGRKAMTGDTLFVVGHGDVQLIAVPNEGGFAPGIPDYKADLYSSPDPEDGVRIQTMTGPQALNPGAYSDYIAGESPEFKPRITVARVLPQTSTTDLAGVVNNVVNWWENLFNFNFIAGPEGSGAPYGTLCPPKTPIDASVTCTVLYKESIVEKYNSPNLGEKKECVFDLGVTVTGKLYHPYFTRQAVVAGIGVCSQLWCGLTYNNNLNLSVSSDESQENSDWKLDNPQVEFGFTADIGFQASVLSGTGYDLQGSGSASASLKLLIGYNVGPKQIFAQLKLGPATIKVEAKVVNQTNMGDSKPLFNLISEEVQLFDGGDIPPVVLHTLD